MNIVGSKHLQKDERKWIEDMLRDGIRCKEIAFRLNRDERCISREVKNRRYAKENNRYKFNGAIPKQCKLLSRYPFVCNGCQKRKICTYETKYFYDAEIAQQKYEELRSESRTGLDVTLEEKIEFDTILKKGIEQGQSIHHIVKSNPNLCYSERSAYRLVDKNETTVQAIDLRRKVKLKPRKHYVPKEDNQAVREGRTYAHFLSFLAHNPAMNITELDTEKDQEMANTNVS